MKGTPFVYKAKGYFPKLHANQDVYGNSFISMEERTL